MEQLPIRIQINILEQAKERLLNQNERGICIAINRVLNITENLPVIESQIENYMPKVFKYIEDKKKELGTYQNYWVIPEGEDQLYFRIKHIDIMIDMLKQELKSDIPELKTGMRVVRRNNQTRFVVKDKCFCNEDGLQIPLNSYSDDLKDKTNDYEFDIMKIYDIPENSNEFFNIKKRGKLLWEREEKPKYRSMTELPELGRKVRIYNLTNGCHGAENKEGYVVAKNTISSAGVFKSNTIFFKVYIPEFNSVWKISGDWKYIL